LLEIDCNHRVYIEFAVNSPHTLLQIHFYLLIIYQDDYFNFM